MIKKIAAMTALVFLLHGCDKNTDGDDSAAFASRYKALSGETTLLTGATVLTGAGERLDDADVLFSDGMIVAVGSDLTADGATVVDASGKWITPGVIDVHSHLGVYPSPGTPS